MLFAFYIHLQGLKNIIHFYHLIKPLSDSILIILLHMNKPSLREVKCVRQGHTVVNALNAGSLDLKAFLFHL